MKRLALLIGFCLTQAAIADMTETGAEDAVRRMPCEGGMNVDQVLKQRIRSRSQRDLGWKVFEDGDHQYDVVRRILISKAMRINYHWKVDDQGRIRAFGGRAEKLCGGGS
ncbi:MAG: hypothetical protein ACU833_06750 [Gammaproteobacteria bacterium]